MPADYHMHTPLCHHAEGDPVAYVEAAAAAGLDEIGFSDHAPTPTPEPYDDWRMGWADFPRYLELVEAARERGRELGVTVRLGLECDYLAAHEDWLGEAAGLAPFDYLIGSVHYVEPDWAIDDPAYLGTLRSMDQERLWARYWELFARLAETGSVDILAHPDLPKKFGLRPPGDRRRFYEPAIAAVAASGAAIEINTAGWRKPVGEAYPEPAFLELACRAGIPLVISSDAHHPSEVGADFSRAIDLARAAGYDSTVRFSGRQRRAEPLAAPRR